jgi:hypothetical protein
VGALRHNEADLAEEDRAVLDKLFEHPPRLKQDYLFRNQLTGIFDQNMALTVFRTAIKSL